MPEVSWGRPKIISQYTQDRVSDPSSHFDFEVLSNKTYL